MNLSGRELRNHIFLVEENLAQLPAHPERKEPVYGCVIRLVIAMLRAQGIKVHIDGAENIPADGAALLAVNHTGYYDFIFAGTVARVRGGRLVRFMAKKEIFDVPVVNFLMRKMKHIRVDRSAGAGSLDAAVESLQQGNLVGIFPEGTISRSFELRELKTGAARIADQAGVPLIPMALWGSQRVWTKGVPRSIGRHHYPMWLKVGAPIECSGDVVADTKALHAAMKALLDEVRADYDAVYGPFPEGQRWRPASMGGSAPTLEEAAEIDARVKALKAERKAAKKRR
ncbi:lysophospholipid acyltransferase family protein [Corynebacterium felinum]|uniref:1-acyl-sn-glycerol-3-phosphate acyltransferase n=1 Tax=Corynebacterium felinum TaxID=131318 RepID=A0ABU2B625_9CORY|nr:lysophospholipid acyltransferase family protein [Corynebacterium felinum]MDF5820817.1 lysophospholipid acyltransferase family protein [Corynebacterium felinum]MDR7354067.1 1-acyl-sn-glycerol-3-phosphate acyltransferase [Corynebacterium felinum]WJY96239.1 1-acyl-sn-glycerol-3-phosphate acyltransferase [Corynebacterium felinum]